MPGYSASPLSFPAFRGATRRLILLNLAAYFLVLILAWLPSMLESFGGRSLPMNLYWIFGFDAPGFLEGRIWQPLTYSLLHTALWGTLFELLSLWFLAGFLEDGHSESWISGLYWVSVLGTSAAALVLYLAGHALHLAVFGLPLAGCFGGIFGLLTAIGVLYGDTEFLMFFLIGIKARYLVAIYALIAIAMLFGSQRLYAFAQLGGALAGWMWARHAPRRGVGFTLSESLYAVRNRYYRWKRRRAARKFEVYMKQHGRTVRFDGNGRPLHDDPNDRSRWN